MNEQTDKIKATKKAYHFTQVLAVSVFWSWIVLFVSSFVSSLFIGWWWKLTMIAFALAIPMFLLGLFLASVSNGLKVKLDSLTESKETR